MKYPKFKRSSRNAYLFEGLVAEIATTELGTDRSGANPRSRAIGVYCVNQYTGSEMRVGRGYTHKSRDLRGTNNLMAVLHDTVTNAGNPIQASVYQRQMHIEVVRSIRNYLGQQPIESGFLGERVGLGLLTRYAHPDMFAFPALPHHEQDVDLAGHYDIGVVIRNPDNSVSSHHLQNKSGCFGICADGTKSKYYERDRARYRPFVQFVSGCCHLDMSRAVSRTATAELLLKEADDVATSHEVKELDNLTDRLVFDMTAGILPRGTAEVAGLNFASGIFDRIV